MKIPIFKTNRRIPMSRWFDELNDPSRFIRSGADTLPVTDISKGLPNQIRTIVLPENWVDDWEYSIERRFISLEGCDGCEGCSPEFYEQEPKPSLLTKLKNRFKK